MRIIISPAKKMRHDRDSLPWIDLPVFLPKTREVLDSLRALPDSQRKALWKCNDTIAALNNDRILNMDLESNLSPAILSYEGIQYRFMAPGVFTDEEFHYIQEHLRILSGFYGLLKPFDGVTPYRLEMQAKLKVGKCRDLYDFWGRDLAENLILESDCIINLASKEYSTAISRYLNSSCRYITCVFAQQQGGRLLEKGTLCKMAKGEMVRFIAGNNITDPKQLSEFVGLGYRYSQEYSSPDTYVFIGAAAPEH